MLDVPTAMVKDFEQLYYEVLETKHQDVLDKLKAGMLDDEITTVLKDEAKAVAAKFKINKL